MACYIFGKNSSPGKSINYKSRLEYQLYLARENPEPVFDLSECNLRCVPSGIYSLCKVFRKERLLLQVNQLTSLSDGGQLSDLYLLTVLDIHTNNLAVLPEDISLLLNLEELNISHNKIKILPEAIGSLKKLKLFDCSHNKLKYIPTSLGNLVSLMVLDIRNNTHLTAIPSTVSQIPSLKQLLCDKQIFEALPPTGGMQDGRPIIFSQHNCEDLTVQDDEKLEHRMFQTVKNVHKISRNNFQEQDSFELFGRNKEKKLQELVKVEKDLQEQKDNVFKMHQNIKENKTKMIDTLKELEHKLEEEVLRFQNKKEQERAKLVDHLLEEAMESLSVEECSRKNRLCTNIKTTEAIQDFLSKEGEWEKSISSLICNRNSDKYALLSTVEADMETQQELVATLLERSDMRTQSLLTQMSLIQQQLAVLTAVELERRNIDSQLQLSYIADKRKGLSGLLVDLLQEQGERRKHLIERLHELEKYDDISEKDPDFWLKQYQPLLHVGLEQLKAVLDPQLVHQFVVAGICHYLPIIATLDIQSLDATHLIQLGIKNESDQLAIMEAINKYITHKQAQYMPSAPPEEIMPSAPPAVVYTRDSLLECVVCMERECTIVFVPCGHLCTCRTCAIQLHKCPLCRSSLEHKVPVIIP